MSNMSMGIVPQLFPVSVITQYPGLGFGDTLEGIEADADAISKFIEKFPEAKAEWKDWKVLLHNLWGHHVFLRPRNQYVSPPTSRARRWVVLANADLIKSLGGAPVALPLPDMYMNLKTGVIDAVIVTWAAILAFKLWEVAPYFYDYGIGGQAGL